MTFDADVACATSGEERIFKRTQIIIAIHSAHVSKSWCNDKFFQVLFVYKSGPSGT